MCACLSLSFSFFSVRWVCVCAGQDVHKSQRTEGAAQAVTRNKLIPTNRFVQVIYRHLDPSSCESKRRHLPAPHTHTHTIFFSSSYYWTEREFINSECHSAHIFLCIGSLLLLLLLFLRCMPEQFERNQWGDWKKKKPKRQQQQLRCWPEIAEHSFRGEGVKKPTQVNTRSFKGKYCALLRTRKERERVFWHPETAQNSALFPIRYVILSFESDKREIIYVTQLLLVCGFARLESSRLVEYGAGPPLGWTRRKFFLGPHRKWNRRRSEPRRKDKSILVLVSRCLIKAESEPTAARKVMNNQQVVARGECAAAVPVYTYIYSI